jgi:hypothetical protein
MELKHLELRPELLGCFWMRNEASESGYDNISLDFQNILFLLSYLKINLHQTQKMILFGFLLGVSFFLVGS